MSYLNVKDPFDSRRKVKALRPKARMGGTVTRNGVNVDKEIEAQTAKKYALRKRTK